VPQHEDNPELYRLLNIADPDAPIYRIFPLWFFEEFLRLRQLVLVLPASWEDPFEVLPESILLQDRRPTPWSQHSLEPLLTAAYAQCWSQTEESDTLIRAYSRVVKDSHFSRNTDPRSEGVRVRTTPKKLLRAVLNWARNLDGVECYIGAVLYKSRDQLKQYLANMIAQHTPDTIGHRQPRAELLLVKRMAFAHEAEVRLICVDHRGVGSNGLVRIPVDPPDLIEEVTFDPRLESFERIEREKLAKSLGYTGTFGASDLYQRTVLLVPMPDGWAEFYSQ